MADLQILGDGVFSVREDGQVKVTFKGAPNGYGEGQYIRMEPYEFGLAWKQGGGAGASSKDNRLELYLGESDTSPPELSVRNNGNGLGAIIQARNHDDTDGLFLDFKIPSAPYVRWGNNGPYLVKHDDQTLIVRNVDNPTISQRVWIAGTYTPGGAREYLSLGVEHANRFGVRTGGFGGGVQNPLDIDGSQVHLQTAGVMRWMVDADGLLKAAGVTSSFPALKRSGNGLEVRAADDSAFAPATVSTVKTDPVTVSALPSASAAGMGARAFVTDASSSTFGSAVVGGGSNAVPVWSNGTGWFVG